MAKEMSQQQIVDNLFKSRSKRKFLHTDQEVRSCKARRKAEYLKEMIAIEKEYQL